MVFFWLGRHVWTLPVAVHVTWCFGLGRQDGTGGAVVLFPLAPDGNSNLFAAQRTKSMSVNLSSGMCCHPQTVFDFASVLHLCISSCDSGTVAHCSGGSERSSIGENTHIMITHDC